MVINGKERLACKTLLKELTDREGTKLFIEPLRTLPVQKDLMVDQTIFFKKYRQIKPFFINHEKAGTKERRQSPEQREKIDAATSCILCAACYSACPVVQRENPLFLGPAAIVQASRFNNDSRDRGFKQRRPELDNPDGIWPCKNHFNCTQVCPRNIKITKIINLEKNKMKHFQGPGGGTRKSRIEASHSTMKKNHSSPRAALLENLEIHHEASAERFAVRLGNKLGYLAYKKRGDKILDFIQVYIPPEFRNLRIAEKLTETALQYAGRKGFTVIPSCSYVAAHLKRIKRRRKQP